MGFFADALVGTARALSGGRIDRFCRELDWSIDERKGKAIGLNFKCPVVGRRTVYIVGGDDPLVLFGTYSKVSFSTRQMPDDANCFALVHNEKMPFGKWELDVDGDEAKFRLSYNALAGGLNAEMLKVICLEFVEDAATLDKWMMKEGYLR